MTGLNIAVSQDEWAPFTHASTEQLAGDLPILAKYVDLRKLLEDHARAEAAADTTHPVPG